MNASTQDIDRPQPITSAAAPLRMGEMQFAVAESSLGHVLVARSDVGLCAVLLGDDAAQLQRELQERFPAATLLDGSDALGGLASAVVQFIESPARGLDVPLDVRGTDFQRTVWRALRDIPAGSTASYSEVANRIGNPKAVRAVAHACAANTLAVVIPCHRVVTTEGKVSGYRWGVERKRALLRREATA